MFPRLKSVVVLLFIFLLAIVILGKNCFYFTRQNIFMGTLSDRINLQQIAGEKIDMK